MVFDIKNKVALITGGASGIGFEIANVLLRNGLKAVSIVDVNEENGKQAVQQIKSEFGDNRAIFIKTDVSKKDQLEAAFQTTISTWKELNIVINNAGVVDENNYDLVIGVNCIGVLQGSLLAMKYMGKHNGGQGGVVANTASIAALERVESVPIYVGTKHFIVGMSRSFGSDFYWNLTGVRFVVMCPGATMTPILSHVYKALPKDFPGLAKKIEEDISRHTMQKPEDVANGMITLITEGENGSVWVSEGGEPVYEIEFPDRSTLRKN